MNIGFIPIDRSQGSTIPAGALTNVSNKNCVPTNGQKINIDFSKLTPLDKTERQPNDRILDA